MKFNLKMLLACFMALFATTVATANEENKQLPVDKTVRMGKLKNGLTYYIRHNENPKNLVNFYIAQKVGSIQEEEDQRGLAHFLEHMCFNGTDHFPGKGIINYLEGIGVKFGADLNAYTSIDETVYNIDNVPVNIEGAIDSCLWILRDWADGLTLDPEEIDKERGVIHEEWRGRNTAMMRMQERMLADIFPGNKYGTRLPIGIMEVVDFFPYQALRDYYEKWYRPDLQGIIIVGDIDVNKMEKKVKKVFKSLEKAKNPAERVYYPVEDNEEMIFSQQIDKEQQNYVLQLMYKHDAAPRELRNTKGEIRNNTVRSLAMSLLNTRFSEIMSKENPPYLRAGVGYSDYGTSMTKKSFNVSVTCKEEQIMEAIPMVFTEVERARRYGFTESELKRIKESMFSGIESWYAERDKRTNGYHAENCIRHFLDEASMMSPEVEYELSKEIINSITLDEVNAVIPSLHRKDNRVVVSYAPEKENVIYPGKEDIEMLLDMIAAARNIAPYEDDTVDAPLLAELPQGGKVVSTEEGKWGTTIWTLSNGIKVVVKSTDFQSDNITLAGYKIGGTNRYDDSERINISMLGSLSGVGGFGAFDATQLSKKLAGSTANANIGSGQMYDVINGSCSTKDAEEMFQLMYLKYTSPRKDVKAFESLTTRMKNGLKDRNLNPNTALSDTLVLALYNNHPRALPMLAEDVDKIDYDRVLEIYKERTSDATGYVFFIVGNVDLESIKPLVEQYIGALPCNGRNEELIMTSVKTRKGVYRNNFKNKMENPTGTEIIYYSGEIEPTLKNRLTMSFLSQILQIVYTEEVREKEGGAYGVGVSGSVVRNPGEFSLTVNFNMAPERREELANIIVREFKKMSEEGPASEHVEKVRSYILKNFEESQRKNSAWMNWLHNFYIDGEDNHDTFESVVNSITKEDVRELAEYIISLGNFIEVSMVPAE